MYVVECRKSPCTNCPRSHYSPGPRKQQDVWPTVYYHAIVVINIQKYHLYFTDQISYTIRVIDTKLNHVKLAQINSSMY